VLPRTAVRVPDPEATPLAGRNKTTFAKMNRETKVREKRQATLERKERRQRERDAGIEVEHQVEDLSHLDVAFVEGVEPDVGVKR
jgi:hypothetical protein